MAISVDLDSIKDLKFKFSDSDLKSIIEEYQRLRRHFDSAIMFAASDYKRDIEFTVRLVGAFPKEIEDIQLSKNAEFATKIIYSYNRIEVVDLDINK